VFFSFPAVLFFYSSGSPRPFVSGAAPLFPQRLIVFLCLPSCDLPVSLLELALMAVFLEGSVWMGIDFSGGPCKDTLFFSSFFRSNSFCRGSADLAPGLGLYFAGNTDGEILRPLFSSIRV